MLKTVAVLQPPPKTEATASKNGKVTVTGIGNHYFASAYLHIDTLEIRRVVQFHVDLFCVLFLYDNKCIAT